MPFINTKVSVEITEKSERFLKERFAEIITEFPGKSEAWLMLNFEQNCHMYFRGSNDKPCAFIEISLYGRANPASCDRVTAKITQAVSNELDIPSDRIYVKYQEIEHWGWNGSNF